MDKNAVKTFIKEVERSENPYYDKKEFLKLLNEFDRFIGMNDEKKEVIVSLKKVMYKMNIGEPFGKDDTPMSVLIMGQQGVGKTEFAKIYAKLLVCISKPKPILRDKPETLCIKRTIIRKQHKIPELLSYLFTVTFLVLSMVVLYIFSIVNKNSKNLLRGCMGIIFLLFIFASLDFWVDLDALIRYLETGDPNMIYKRKPITIELKISEPYVILRKADLVAQHIGETPIKTRKALNNHVGKAIIIDEFYDILRNEESERSFGPECVTAIMEFMDNNPNNPIFFLGYEEDLKSGILKSQKGFVRRCGVKITLKKYTSDELYAMFMTKLEDNGLEVKKDTKKEVAELFKSNANYLVNYGGDVRLLVGKITDSIAEKYYNSTKKHTDVSINYVKNAFSKIIKDNKTVKDNVGSLIDVY